MYNDKYGLCVELEEAMKSLTSKKKKVVSLTFEICTYCKRCSKGQACGAQQWVKAGTRVQFTNFCLGSL